MIAVTALVLAQYAGTLDLSETSRVDGRANQPMPILPSPPREVAIAADASIAPLARLRLTNRTLDWIFTYSPSFTITDIELGPLSTPVVLNAGSASVAWHDRFVRITVSESASYGWENLAYLYGAPATPQAAPAGQTPAAGGAAGGQPVAGQPAAGQTGQTQTVVQKGVSTTPLTTFPFGSSNTSANVSIRASRKVSLFVSGGYSITGNLSDNPQATVVYPEQYGPQGAAGVSYTPTRLDSFVTTASAANTTTPMGLCVPAQAGQYCRQDVPVITASEAWRRRLSATASISATAGASATIYDLNTGHAWGILPVVGLAYANRFGPPPRNVYDPIEPSGFRASVDLGSTINAFTGSPSSRVSLNATLVQRLSTKLGLSFNAGALQTVPVPNPDPSPLTLLMGGVDLKVAVTKLITLSTGVNAFWQTQQNVGVVPVGTPGSTTTATEVGYVAVSIRVPRLKL